MFRGFTKAGNGLGAAIALAGGSAAYAAVTPFATLPANIGPGVPSGTTGGPVNWDANGDAVTDFQFNYRFPNSTGTTGVVWQANMNPVSTTGAAVVGYLGPFINYASNMANGRTVGPVLTPGSNGSTPTFRTAAQVTLGSQYRSGGVPSNYGGFAAGTPNVGGDGPGANLGFVGFRFGSGANTRYGYLQVQTGPNGQGIQFLQGFFESTPNTAITIGGGGGTVPEPTSLGALALGATAVLARRKRVA